MDAAERATSDDRAITFIRTFDAPRALVWAAWTDPRHVAAWWGPVGFQALDCEIDLRVGGAFRLDLGGPDGAIHPCRGVFREIVPLERFVIEGEPNAQHSCGAGLPPGARVTVSLTERDGKTTLTLDTRFDTAVARQAAEQAGYRAGWTDSQERLAAHLRQMQG